VITECSIDSYGLGFDISKSDPFSVKSEIVQSGSSSFKISNFVFSALLKDIELVQVDIQVDKNKNFVLFAQFKAPEFKASGNYVDGKNKGSVSIVGSE
jgi:hypothetical protein